MTILDVTWMPPHAGFNIGIYFFATIILAVLIGIRGFLSKDIHNGFWDYFLCALPVLAIFFMFLSFIIGGTAEDKTDTTKEYIVSLNDGTMISESTFVLGSGHIDGEMAYFYYEEHDGGYRRDHIRGNDIVIREVLDSGETAYIKRIHEYNSREGLYKYLGAANNYVRDIYIYVPENTVTKEVTIDNKN